MLETDRVVVDMNGAKMDQDTVDKPIKSEEPLVDVYEDVNTAVLDPVIAELDGPIGIPQFILYLIKGAVLTLLLMIPAVTIQFYSTKFGSLESVIFHASVLFSIAAAVCHIILALFALLAYGFGLARAVVGIRLRLWLTYLLRMRSSAAFLMSIFIAWTIAEPRFVFPNGFLRSYVILLILSSLLLAKDILIIIIGNKYNAVHLEKKVEENREALKSLKLLWKYHLPDYNIHISRTGTRHRDAEAHVTMKIAEDLGRRLFQELKLFTGKSILETEDFQHVLKENKSQDFVNYLDVDHNGNLNENDFLSGTARIYKERSKLMLSLNDCSVIVKHLGELMSAFCWVITFMIWISIFNVSLTSKVLLQMNFLIVLSFFFGSIATEAFQSIIFVFALHPFDSGDMIVVQGIKCSVKKIGIWNCTLQDLGKQWIYRRNSRIALIKITNFNRSPPQAVEFQIALHYDTTREQLIKMEHEINVFIKENPRDFLPDDCYVKNISIVNSESIIFQMQYTHRSNASDRTVYNRRHALMRKGIREIVDRLQIRYAPYSVDLPRCQMTGF